MRHGFRWLAGVCRDRVRVESAAVSKPAIRHPFRTSNAGPRPHTSRAIRLACARCRTAPPHVSRDTSRVRAMGVYGGVRSGDGAGRAGACYREPIALGRCRSFSVLSGRPFVEASAVPPMPNRSLVHFACARWGCTVAYGQAMAPAVPEPATGNRLRSDDAAVFPSCQGDLSSKPLPYRRYRTARMYISRARDGGVRWRTVRRWPAWVRVGGGGSLACWPGVAWVEGREGRRRRPPVPTLPRAGGRE